jgi:hypothetical protein
MPSYTVQTAEIGRPVLGWPSHMGWWPNMMEIGDDARPRWRWRRWGIPASQHRRWVGNRCCGRAAVWWTNLRQKRGQRGAHRSCPRWCLRLTGNQRWRHGLGAEGQATGSGSYAALHQSTGMGRLGDRRGRGNTARWFHNGGMVVQWGRKREKGSFTGVERPL